MLRGAAEFARAQLLEAREVSLLCIKSSEMAHFVLTRNEELCCCAYVKVKKT
jgi:hypothetical protein